MKRQSAPLKFFAMPTDDIASARSFLDAARALAPRYATGVSARRGAIIQLMIPARAPIRIVIHDPRAEAA